MHEDSDAVLVCYSELRIKLRHTDSFWSIECHIFELGLVSFQLARVGLVQSKIEAVQLVELGMLRLVKSKHSREETESLCLCLSLLCVEMDSKDLWPICWWESADVANEHIFSTSGVWDDVLSQALRRVRQACQVGRIC